MFDVLLISTGDITVTAKNGLKIIAHHTIKEINSLDILLIPGGKGARPLVNNSEFIEWVRSVSQGCELVLSVCTGALLLAKAGILDGLKATTHHQAYHELREIITDTKIVEEGQRFVDNGRVITSGGISAGIDMSFHVIERLYGKDAAERTSDYMEYRRVIE